MRKLILSGLVATTIGLAAPMAHANLLVNGDFSASTSEYTTPPGWTQLGPSDGVIANSVFGTPSYNGTVSFYDLGGFGDYNGTVGDGLEQSIATLPGNAYALTFGLSDENVEGTTTLQVGVGGTDTYYTQTAQAPNISDGQLQYPWTTETIDFTASAANTVIAFSISNQMSGGNNDPLIAGVDLESTSSSTPVPEPATLALFAAALAGVFAIRHRKLGNQI